MIGSSGTNDFVEALVLDQLAPRLQKLSLSLDDDVEFERVLTALRKPTLREFVLMSKVAISADNLKLLNMQFPGDSIRAQEHVVSWSKE